MNLAILLYQYTDNPKGVPADWPAEVIPLGNSTTLPSGNGWQLMTEEEYITYKATHLSTYNTWESTQPTTLPYSEEPENVESLGLSSTTSTTFQQKVRLTSGNLPGGKYRIGWAYDWQLSSTTDSFLAQVQIDDLTVVMTHSEEPKKTTTVYKVGGFAYITLTGGVHTFDLDYSSSKTSVSAKIQNARLELWSTTKC